ncbi:Mss4-like protein [Truncatella angustata]|uniref:Mss4-like protein n=1 Tax=Truncatella angustata TaxID=152316 RepID=A0A9P8UQ46_9PEZI|nr:Mss4-like protein [Truncatella angustata]KAH6656905.1 Mss4-like protein [Truncatella angustata]
MAKGHCLCRNIEVTSEIEPKAIVACSCTSCQACSASAFTINLVYPKDSITVSKGKDHLKVFKEKADSGNDVFRHFCDICGNAIYTQTVDGTFFVKGPVMKGLHNDPVAHIFTRNLPRWAEGVKTGDRKKDGA